MSYTNADYKEIEKAHPSEEAPYIIKKLKEIDRAKRSDRRKK